MTSPVQQWTNWAGTVTASPVRVVTPTSTQEVAQAVRDAVRDGLRVKAVGSGHSFSPVAVADGVLLDLSGMSGIVAVQGRRVRVRAGMRLSALSRALRERGLALANLGDIDVQTVAGAISTGTHGTGARFTGLSGMVRGLELVTGQGRVVWVSREQDPDLFDAARVGLGAFGVVTQVEIECVPAFRLEAVEAPMAVSRLRSELFDLVAAHDHFEFFWFPGTSVVATKANRRLGPGEVGAPPLGAVRRVLEDEVLSNSLFAATSRVVSVAPGLTPAINAVAARALGARTYTGESFGVFASPRRVRFVESEYAVPREAVLDVLAELSAWLRQTDFRTPFPVEVRFAAADDAWLSTGYERENAYVAVHQYHRMAHEPYFAAFEEVVARHAGRPHWGKMHGLGAARLRELYPRFDDALRVRDEVDPGRVFTNPHLERVLG